MHGHGWPPKATKSSVKPENGSPNGSQSTCGFTVDFSPTRMFSLRIRTPDPHDSASDLPNFADGIGHRRSDKKQNAPNSFESWNARLNSPPPKTAHNQPNGSGGGCEWLGWATCKGWLRLHTADRFGLPRPTEPARC